MMWEKIEATFQHLQFGRAKQLAFLEDLRLLLDDGVPLNKAIDTVAQTAEGAEKLVALHLGQGLARGQQLADGMQAWFKPAVVELVRAGESSGALQKTLASAQTTLIEQNQALSAFLHATLYPLLVIFISCFVIIFITDSVLADFANMKPVVSWPEPGQILMALGSGIQTWWLLLLSLLVALSLGLWVFLQKSTGVLRRQIDALPILSLYRRSLAARFMETLGLLMNNGIALKKALVIMQNQAQPYFAWHLLMMEYRLSGGVDNVADVLDTDLLERRDLMRLRVVSQGNKGFAKALISLGKQASQRNAKAITLTGKIVGTTLLVAAAAIAALIIYAIYSVGSVLTT